MRHPQDKPRVENQVAYVRERWFAGETFRADVGELRDAAARWCHDVAGTRVHGTTRRVPREVYELEEQPLMTALREGIFDVPTWTKAKVHPDHHAQIARSLYSLPTRYIGKTLDARADRVSVRFYLGSEMIKRHARVAPGKRSTDPNDYPVGKADYALRSVDKLKARACEHGEHVGSFAERLLFDVVDVSRIERMLKNAAQSAVDRFKNNAYDLVVDGESYRARLKPNVDNDGPPPVAPVTRPPPARRRPRPVR